MTDERLNELLDDASRTYRVPTPPDVDGIWAEVEREAFDRPAHPRWRSMSVHSPSWRVLGFAVAAALVAGVGLGRVTSRPAAAPMVVGAFDTASQSLPDGYDRAASELLGKTAMLLTALPSEAESGRTSNRFALQAGELLTSTRLLLDSPAASDRRFKELLEDLELILAQVARLRSARGPEELELITDALEERDVLPRIRSAVTRFSLGDD
jgi:hypothetical protein